jgi:hypothetical protein
MTITVPGMRSNKSVNMDIDQLREWASLMDKAMIASFVTVILAVTALGITTFLGSRAIFHRALSKQLTGTIGLSELRPSCAPM